MHFINALLQSLKEQFPCKDGYRIAHCKDFNFKEDDAEPYIRVIVQPQHTQCEIGMEPMDAMVSFQEHISYCNIIASYQAHKLIQFTCKQGESLVHF